MIPIKKHLRTVRMRVILLFLACLLPIYSIGAGIFLWGRTMIEHQINDAQANRTAFISDSLQAEIARLLQLQYNFFFDFSLSKLTDTMHIMDNYERDMCIIDIENRLRTIQYSSRHVLSIAVLIPSIDKNISSTSVAALRTQDNDVIERFKGSVDPATYVLDGNLCLYVSAHVGYHLQDKLMPKYGMVTELSNRELARTMRTQLQTDEQYICVSGSGYFLSSLGEDTGRAYAQTLAQQGIDGEAPARSIRLGGARYRVLATQLDALDLTYISLIPEALIYRPMHLFLGLFALFSVTIVFVLLFFSSHVKSNIHLPLVKLQKALQSVTNGHLNTVISYGGHDEFQYIYDAFNSMTRQLDHLTVQVYKNKILAQKAELRQLQAQINPHFLFNSFFILKRRIRDGDVEKSMEMANALGEYFQFITRTAASSVPLCEEVRHARIYTQIQSARFGDRIKLQFDQLPEAYSDLMVERLILQPIIENAFEHGLECLKGGGVLHISFRASADMLTICVEDNGDSLKSAQMDDLKKQLGASIDEINDDEMEVTGILNIHRRIQYKMGPQSGIWLKRSHTGGLMVEIRLGLTQKHGKENGDV